MQPMRSQEVSKTYGRSPLLLSTFVVSQLVWWLPLLMYLSNSGEFTFGLGGAAWRLGAIGLLFLGALFLVGRWTGRVLSVILLWLALGIYVQSNLLLWDYGTFDGHPIAWSKFSSRGIIDGAIWGALLVLAVFGRRVLLPRTTIVVLFLTMLHAAAILPFLHGTTTTWWSDPAVKGREQFAALSKEKNVIIVLLDAFSAPALSEILASTPQYRELLSGFTFYNNVTSEFPSTFLSVPSLLSGEPYQGKESVETYLTETFGKGSLPAGLAGAGYSVGLRTLRSFCRFLEPLTCFGFTMSLQSEWSAKNVEALALLDLALFRASPQTIKQFIFNDDQWRLRNTRITPGSKGRTEEPHVGFMREFIQAIVPTNASPTFRFVHLLLPHYPVRVNRECAIYARPRRITKKSFHDQARCGLKLIHELVTALARQEILDQTMVIVLGDHGTNLPYPQFPKKELKARGLPKISKFLPLYLVKPFGPKRDFTVRSVPGRLADTPAMVLAALGLPYSGTGLDVAALDDAFQRDRTVYNLPLRWAMWKKGVGERQIENLRAMKVRGNAGDVAHWEVQQQPLPSGGPQ